MDGAGARPSAQASTGKVEGGHAQHLALSDGDPQESHEGTDAG